MHHQYVAPPFDLPGPDPLAQFDAWFADAQAAGVPEPEAMTLATAGPHARVVLMRGRFRFFTNYDSAKAQQIAADPRVALTFFWQPLHRSVRVEGTAAKVPPADSDAYFATRPRGSQLGAWASPQSQVISAPLEVPDPFEGDVPRPPNWGGYEVTPDLIEFWQGRPNRVHDRWRYRRSGDGWHAERLAP